ncbi:hypothetical protein H310_12615, partial [Aphanomyces invadans]
MSAPHDAVRAHWSVPSADDDAAFALALAAQFADDDLNAAEIASTDAALAQALAAGTIETPAERDARPDAVWMRPYDATFESHDSLDEWIVRDETPPHDDDASRALAEALAAQFDHELAVELSFAPAEDHDVGAAYAMDDGDDDSIAFETNDMSIPAVRGRNRRVSWFGQSSKSSMRKGVRIALD